MFKLFRQKAPVPLSDFIQDPKIRKKLGAGSGQKVLFATSVSGNGLVTSVDSLLSTALSVRGHQPQFLICDKALTACEVAQIGQSSGEKPKAPSKPHCENCYSSGLQFLKKFPFPIHQYTSFVEKNEGLEIQALVETKRLNECFQYVEDKIKIGEQVRAGVIRFFGSSQLQTEDQAYLLNVAREYLASGIFVKRVAERAFQKIKPDVVVNHHGVYVPQGIIDAVASRDGIRLVVWGTSYRKGTFIFSHNDTYHRTFLNEPTDSWEKMNWDSRKENAILEYLADRRAGKGDWSWVTPDRGGVRSEKQLELLKAIQLAPNKPTFGLLTNIGWDAQIFYANCAFESMIEWLHSTIQFFVDHPEKQLIVRIHPHEVKAGNREYAMPLIRQRFPTLPSNIAIIQHDSNHNTYDLMDLCQAVILFGTKTGVELAPFGKPVLVAADAWIRNKGISFDANSKEDYFALLEKIETIPTLSKKIQERARKFAYHYFFRRMIPCKPFEGEGAFPPVARVRNLKDLDRGSDPALDSIMDGILEGKPFIFEPIK